MDTLRKNHTTELEKMWKESVDKDVRTEHLMNDLKVSQTNEIKMKKG